MFLQSRQLNIFDFNNNTDPDQKIMTSGRRTPITKRKTDPYQEVKKPRRRRDTIAERKL